jgi:hypothetical protein
MFNYFSLDDIKYFYFCYFNKLSVNLILNNRLLGWKDLNCYKKINLKFGE